jgi:CMP-N-acetylneuraminic acid synthetase
MKEITAIIPVRKGSQRVKNKNIKKFADSSLLEIKIDQLKNTSRINRIIVSSDCDMMLSIAKKKGVETHRRDEYYASSVATNSDFFWNLADSFNCEHIMYAPVTCPLISIETILECIERYETCDNVVTVSPIKHHLWLNNNPLNYDVNNSPNSQDLPNIYSITYGVSIIERNKMLEFKNVVTDNPHFKVLDEIESVDIDTELDFLIAEFLYKKMLSVK